MVDEKNKSSDDEYQFPKDEYVSPEELHDGAKNAPDSEQPAARGMHRFPIKEWLTRFSHFKNKRMILIIVAVIVLLIIVHLMNAFKKSNLPPISSQPAQTTATTPVSSSPALSASDEMASMGSRTQTEIQNLKSQLSDMQNSLSAVQTQNQQLQQALSALTEQLQTLSTEVNQALMKRRPGVRAKLMVYHLRAVVPDRAWIASNNGQSFSVTIGNHVRDYGTVQAIDAQNGIIKTSSGRVIKYGANDY